MGLFLKRKYKKFFPSSVLASLSLHMLGLLLFQQQSVWFSSPSIPKPPSQSWVDSIEKREKDRIFKESFSQMRTDFAKQKQEPQLESEGPIALQIQPSSLLEKKETSAPLVSLEPVDTIDFKHPVVLFSPPTQKGRDLFEHLSKDLILPLSSIPELIAQHQAPEFLAVDLSLPAQKIPEALAIPPQADLQKNSTAVRSLEIESPPSTLSFALPRLLPQLSSLSEMKSLSFSENFEVELVFFPSEGDGYLFALTLIPRSDLHLAPLKQNYSFLIDRSNSVQKERLHAAKTALVRALDELSESDTFNIIAFDSRIDKAFPSSIAVNRDSIQRAKQFVDAIELGSFFAHTDLIKPLFLTVPSVTQSDELYTAILLTDGESFAKKGASRSLLDDWTRYNNGKVSLYTLSMGGDTHAAALNAACVFNKGKFSSAPTKRGLKRKLLKIMKTVKTPLAKDLSYKAISRASHSILEIYPKSHQMPHLYLDEPYVVIGKTATLTDFIFFVQGQIKGEWFHIKKNISFLNAKKGNSSLKSEFALFKAYDLYDQYLFDHQPEHIAQAQSLLEPFHLQAPFE